MLGETEEERDFFGGEEGVDTDRDDGEKKQGDIGTETERERERERDRERERER